MNGFSIICLSSYLNLNPFRSSTSDSIRTSWDIYVCFFFCRIESHNFLWDIFEVGQVCVFYSNFILDYYKQCRNEWHSYDINHNNLHKWVNRILMHKIQCGQTSCGGGKEGECHISYQGYLDRYAWISQDKLLKSSWEQKQTTILEGIFPVFTSRRFITWDLCRQLVSIVVFHP